MSKVPYASTRSRSCLDNSRSHDGEPEAWQTPA